MRKAYIAYASPKKLGPGYVRIKCGDSGGHVYIRILSSNTMGPMDLLDESSGRLRPIDEKGEIFLNTFEFIP